MLTYSRSSPQEAASDTAAHVRAHLSSVASVSDDPNRFAEDVDVVVVAASADSVLITGTLDREPIADYLRDDYDPEQDVANNPLTVPSIEDES